MASVETRELADGSIVHRVRVRHDGKNIARSFDTADGAERWMHHIAAHGVSSALAQLAKESEPAAGDDPWSVAFLVEHHVVTLTGVTDGTRAGYRSLAKHHIVPHFRDVLASALDADAVRNWVNALEREKLSPKTIRNAHALLSAALTTGAQSGKCESNPARGLRLPRGTRSVEPVFLTREQFATLHSAIHERYRPFVLLLVGTGLRFGEATALRAMDVDLEHVSIHVRRAWKKSPSGERQIGPPKTARGRRTVVIPAPVADALRSLLAGRAPSELVFTTAKGSPITQSTWWHIWMPAIAVLAGDELERRKSPRSKHWEVVVKTRGNGPRPRTHDLRHTFASWAIQSGVPLPVVQRQLGHESITTTVDMYGHLARSDFDALAASTANYLPAPRKEIE